MSDKSTVSSTSQVSKEIVERLAELGDLPRMPQALMELEKMLVEDSPYEVEDIVKVITLDARLTAGIIFMANTAKYSLGETINDLAEAVIRIGLNDIRLLAHTIAYRETFKRKPPFSSDLFMRHGVIAAFVGEQLSTEVGLNSSNGFLCGLMRDLGIYLLALESREKYQQVLKAIDYDMTVLPVHENQAYGTYHALMSARLLQLWKFPNEVVMGVAYHHIPDKSREEFQAYAYLTYLSEMGVFRLGFDNGIGEIPAEYWLNPKAKFLSALQFFNLTVEEFDSVLQKAFELYEKAYPDGM